MLDHVADVLTVDPGLAHDAASVRPVEGRNLAIVRQGRALLQIESIAFGGNGLTAIIGPNGAGKSLLLKTLAGLITPDRGDVRWGGKIPYRAGYRRLGMMLQSAVLMRRSARANMDYALKAAGYSASERAERTDRFLTAAGLQGLSGRSARVLSGGERQRLALARTLAVGPEVLFLDEPTASLDPASTLAIERMVGEAQEGGMRIVLVTHDLAQARRLADEIIFMHRGRIVEQRNAERFFNQPQTAEARAFIAGEILI